MRACSCVYCTFVRVCASCSIAPAAEDRNNTTCIVDIVSTYSKHYHKLWVFFKKNRIHDRIIKFSSHYQCFRARINYLFSDSLHDVVNRSD